MSKKILGLLAAMMLLTGCMMGCREKNTINETNLTTEEPTTECTHQWKITDCEKSKECELCGATEVSDAKHMWKDATCQEPKTCRRCGATEGSTGSHTWKEATCTSPKICSICQAEEGEALGHQWIDATLEAPKTCSVCRKASGTRLYATYGSHFELDRFDCVLDFTIGSTVSWTVATNENNSQIHNRAVAKIPVTIINNDSMDRSPQTIVDYDVYLPSGEYFETGFFIYANLGDDYHSWYDTHGIEPGATLNTYLHIPYYGDGTYKVVLSTVVGDGITLEFEIKK